MPFHQGIAPFGLCATAIGASPDRLSAVESGVTIAWMSSAVVETISPAYIFANDLFPGGGAAGSGGPKG